MIDFDFGALFAGMFVACLICLGFGILIGWAIWG